MPIMIVALVLESKAAVAIALTFVRGTKLVIRGVIQHCVVYRDLDEFCVKCDSVAVV